MTPPAGTPAAPIKVILVDDHQVLRDGIRLLLETSRDFEVVGEAADGRAALRCVEQHDARVVIMDLAMPELNGIEATRQARERRPDALIVCLSMHDDERAVVDAFRAGARGYVLKTGAVVARAIAASADPAQPKAALSSREREVVQLVAEGLTTKEIAARLFVSVKTIEGTAS